MNYSQALKALKAQRNPKAAAGMARYGINPANVLGLSIPFLREMSASIGTDRKLAFQLWGSGIHEARILASMIADPSKFTSGSMDAWAKEFDSWDVTDQCCMNLFEKTSYAYSKAFKWSAAKSEFVKRAGFVMMARLAVSDKTAPDSRFIAFFPSIRKGARDNRNFVKKAVNWAVRQIGKRNSALNKKAMLLSEGLLESDIPSARWVAADALRELKSAAVQKRLLR
ncbi:MAG TPA: DNA alkylation repair protein [Elusimicrobia bacterium]|nr:MAG: DNA alkylation repair protein [Elusimicrobia bacterium RIFOXYA12_FULL_49_49]OGS15182.1 MAG: DNA alkylation repair protein [Elusimicrobia bacterium RIFOXYA2_FULL_47_53]OGS26948.1 MAG: DNA alkylation repair protein [Elusimicrobia bacterium RIFOXYB12_FULL_50_12]OGS29802.1 MAG: DNA alkylation repair protein [Elusimicrobia bacterium RIFOXYB2_FULL_46_23]HBU70285.1 DNA alkylation repair protein [Elusimicrobiota bacterium]